ncbi:bifunctional riboflavin kinase/FAD synthetase [Breoghania sp. L-A4]|uniref:bifunctional riboflavin kinase/FAD synthetase n=1 Tax=Breoghania sp. L-A4 TaxID=2304600 RepID=UPI000E35C349|nr:bifunctional riboflavin kinase/FAD synthetase [Breoghania sp. L-A4]AXS42445.1 bifunctional riboflavin kinase/FAD synthetase [Breoghania sp. L-A4]
MLKPAAPAPQAFQAIPSLEAFPEALRGAVVGIGNFDGVHRGHQAVLEVVRETAKTLSRPAIALTFEPHPRTVFRPDAPVFRLTPEHAKAVLIEKEGLDGILTLPFDRAFAGRTAEDFVDTILVGRLGIAHAVTGYDFHFGKARAGTPDFLREAGEERGFGVSIVGRLGDEGDETISSSRIRQALADGEIVLANALLGYRWFVESEVIDGEKRGRELGYPTANMKLAPETRLAAGIYAVRVNIDGVLHAGVASYGRRPMFDNGAPLLEVHVFDFSGDLYGKRLGVTFVSYLRGEETFDSLDALIAQMDRDSEEARAALASIRPLSPLDQALYDLPHARQA